MLGPHIEFGGKELVIIAATFFGMIHRRISATHQRRSILAIMRKDADAYRGAQMIFVAVYDEWLAHAHQYPFTQFT